MSLINDYLSLWKIAHRWHKIDPNKTDPENLPFEIQDRIRFLCRAVLGADVGLYDEVFISIDQGHQFPKRENRFYEVKELPPEIEKCATSRIYQKSILDAYLIRRDQL